ncbi:hypothetical protein HY946_02940, partial [Candidatus Gottesmanbacteria bacterium]|nr:hypothetical protein [Candidatus Gottesmanbacteria bacterium]
LSLSAGILGIYLFLKKKKNWKIFMFYVLCFMFSLFMASFYSQFIWDRIKPLWYLQFPWRFLVFAALFSSLLSGGFISKLYDKFKKQKIIQGIIVVVPISLVIILNKDYFLPARHLAMTDKDYTNKEELNWRVSKMSFEYVPYGIATVLSDIQTTQVDIKKEELPDKPFEVSSGIKVVNQEILPHIKKFLVEGDGGKLTINTYYFPGWEVKIDGQKVKIDDNNKFKLMTVEVPKGEHWVEAQFMNTPIRNLANILTVASFLSLLILIFLPEYRRKSA